MLWTLALAVAGDRLAEARLEPMLQQVETMPCTSTYDAVSTPVRAARASSELKEGNLVHGASRAIDGDPSTAWVEGVPGVGKGEALRLRVDGDWPDGLQILPGYAKDAARWTKNQRVATVRVQWLKTVTDSVDHDEAWAKDQLVPTTTRPLLVRMATVDGVLPVGKSQFIDFDGVWDQNMEQTEVVAIDLSIVDVEGKGAVYEDTAISEVSWLQPGTVRQVVCAPQWCESQGERAKTIEGCAEGNGTKGAGAPSTE